MTTNGIEAMKVIRGTLDGATFTDFIQDDLVPILNPFNGINRNSIVVMDNCSAHHVSGIKNLINQTGALLHFLPPYSPDLNPIEECFAKVKMCIKNMDTITDTETAVLASFACVTPNDCQHSVKSSSFQIL